MAVNQQGLVSSKDITSDVIEFIARTVHFLIEQERKTLDVGACSVSQR
jgi:hypothetical protein